MCAILESVPDSAPGESDVQVVRFFFFQAEDGIRDLTVTGVQTCALPISARTRFVAPVKFVAIETTWTPVLLMKSLTCVAGDIPKSSSSVPDSGMTPPMLQLLAGLINCFFAE